MVAGRYYSPEDCKRLELPRYREAEKLAVRRLQYWDSYNVWVRSSFIDMVFNLGPSALDGTTIQRLANAGDLAGACQQMPRWVYGTVNGQRARLPGLVDRRDTTRELCAEWGRAGHFSAGGAVIDPRSVLTYAAGVGLVLALGVAGTQTVRLANERAAHSDTRTTHATTLRRLADASARAATAATTALQAAQAVVGAIDTKRTKELTDGIEENERMRAADRPGTGRLRISAVCPGPSAAPGVPSAAAAPGVDAPAAEIAPDARQLVWNLRAALITERAQLLALQDYARACSGAKEPDAIPNP